MECMDLKYVVHCITVTALRCTHTPANPGSKSNVNYTSDQGILHAERQKEPTGASAAQFDPRANTPAQRLWCTFMISVPHRTPAPDLGT